MSILTGRQSTTTSDFADTNRSSFLFNGDEPSYCQGRRRTSRPSLVAIANTTSLKFTRRTGTVTPVLSNKLFVILIVVAVVRSSSSPLFHRRFFIAAPPLVFALLVYKHFPFPLELLGVEIPLVAEILQIFDFQYGGRPPS